jgi:hypothetical protein
MSGSEPPFNFSSTWSRARSLHLISEMTSRHRPAVGLRWRTVVPEYRNVISAGLGVELQPIHGGCPAHEKQFVLREVEQDPVPYHESVVTHGDHLFGPAGNKIREAVDGGVRTELQGIRSRERDFRHVVRLVEQDGAFTPRLLLRAPVAELRGTTGYTYAPICELRSICTGFSTDCKRSFRLRCSMTVSADQRNTTVRLPFTSTRCSTCHFTALASTAHSTSRPA